MQSRAQAVCIFFFFSPPERMRVHILMTRNRHYRLLNCHHHYGCASGVFVHVDTVT